MLCLPGARHRPWPPAEHIPGRHKGSAIACRAPPRDGRYNLVIVRGRSERSLIADSRGEPSAAPEALEQRVLAEQVRMLYARTSIAQATVVVNSALVAWVFWGLAPPALSVAWVAALWALATLRMGLLRAYRRRAPEVSAARIWARRFAAETVLTGIGWGSAALIFYAPHSPLHQVFLAFVLGGMTAGAASSNASYTPAFMAFAAPALLPMVGRLAAERDAIHAVMAFMMTLFGVALAGISRSGSRAVEEAIRLRLRNEALVEGLTGAQRRLEDLNAELERRVSERTSELERMLALRSQAEESLREANRRKSQFIAVLSHELRNPLAPIQNSLYVLDRAAPGSEPAVLAREIIHRQTDHLARLVDDLLDVTRISRGKIELRRGRLDVCEVTRRTCEDHRALFQKRGIELRVDASGPLWAEVDETRIAQVIGNLLQNAAKFGRSGGTVIASAAEADGEAVIRVRDDGIGMTPELLSRVFEPFEQAEGGLSRAKGGLGLGLALAKGLVELHGGRIRAYSEGAGHGSELVLTLPLAPALRQPG
jgi:signal transduction histidine kinase